MSKRLAKILRFVAIPVTMRDFNQVLEYFSKNTESTDFINNIIQIINRIN